MGWGDCGIDNQGRNIGYNFEGVCDKEGCKEIINRGLDTVCGDMHGEDEYSCEKYFCEKHKQNLVQADNKNILRVCEKCRQEFISSGEWTEDEEEGVLIKI